MLATTRLNLRIDPQLRCDIERATSMVGTRSVNEFVAQALREKTRAVLQMHNRILLDNQVFDEFFAACEQEKVPSQGLHDAARLTDKLGIR